MRVREGRQCLVRVGESLCVESVGGSCCACRGLVVWSHRDVCHRDGAKRSKHTEQELCEGGVNCALAAVPAAGHPCAGAWGSGSCCSRCCCRGRAVRAIIRANAILILKTMPRTSDVRMTHHNTHRTNNATMAGQMPRQTFARSVPIVTTVDLGGVRLRRRPSTLPRLHHVAF